MALCLKQVSGLKRRKNEGASGKVRLVDAAWVWTEPHSMRLKIRLTIQREVVAGGTILQQSFVVEFIVRNQQCVECQAAFRQGTWKSLVQVRQRVGHKRTFLYLEQLILKHGAHRGCLSIETFKDGMDFYFPDKGKANRFISFLEDVVPMKVKSSKKLISTDDKSNISNYKFTNLVEICTLCKDDLIFLPKKLAKHIGNISRLVLVKNVSNVINVIDPLTGQTGNIESDAYWRDPFRPMVTAARTRLSRYVVLGNDPLYLERNHSKRGVNKKQRSKLALITTARESDLGMNDAQLEEQSHLGYLMKSGDVALGYDLKEVQVVDDDAEAARAKGKFPNVIFVRKLYGGAATNAVDTSKKRVFQLQRLPMGKGEENEKSKTAKRAAEMEHMDEEDFLQELEADKDMRTMVNIFKKDVVVSKDDEDNQDDEEMNEDDDQKITLDELLDNLVLDTKPDAPDVSQLMQSEAPLGAEDAVLGAGQEQNNMTMFVTDGERAAKDNLGYVGRDDALNMQARDTATVVDGNVWGKDFMQKDGKLP